eukprot:862706-Pyramimonas_sp.AAC.1
MIRIRVRGRSRRNITVDMPPAVAPDFSCNLRKVSEAYPMTDAGYPADVRHFRVPRDISL